MSTTAQNDLVLSALKAGERLTPMDALQRFGCFRLGARCYDLRRQGHNIITDMVHKDGKHFASYRLLSKEPVQSVLI